MRNWYTIENKAESKDTLDITIYDVIGPTWEGEGVTAKQFGKDLAAAGDGIKNINLFVNSPGGSLFDGIAIQNMLRTHGAEISGKVMGIAASAASYVLTACHTIDMPANTFQMLHNVSSGIWGTSADLREWAATMDKLDQSLHATYAARSGKTVDEIKQLLVKDAWLTAAECVDMGFADTVSEAVNATAKFAVTEMPDNIKAVFNAAQPKSKPAAGVVDTAPLAEQVKAAFEKAGLPQFAVHFSLALDDAAAIPKAIAETREVMSYCEIAGQKDKATGYITARMPVAKVREELQNAMAAADEKNVIETARKLENVAKPGAENVKAADIWAKRRKTLNT